MRYIINPKDLLKRESDIMTTDKDFILGIQSLVSSEDSTLRFGDDNKIIIPFPEGIDELNKIAEQFSEKGRIAKRLLNYFSRFKISQLLKEDGVVQKNGSTLKFEDGYRDVVVPARAGKLSSFERRKLQIAIGRKTKNPKKTVILISKNPSFRMKAEAIGVKAQPFKEEIFPPLEEQYQGRIKCETSAEKIEEFHRNGFIYPKDIFKNKEIEWVTNLFLTIKTKTDNHPVLARYDGEKIVPLKFAESNPYGISAKKLGQHFALEALMTSAEEAPIVIIKGGAGTGKTIISLAAGLQQTIEKERAYSQILVTTPIETLREENLGYLPGALEQKFDPYLGGIMDNLTILLGNKLSKKKEKKSTPTKKRQLGSDADDDKGGMNDPRNVPRENARMLIEQGVIVLQLIGHLRGRSITYTYFIIDESQNIEPSVVKSIVTRAGEGSKFVFLGDPTQIDNPELNERYNGLVYLSEKMKGNPLCYQVTLEDEESVRSKLAYIAAKIL